MEHQYISKGIYQYSQIGNFVSVKNYIFIRKDEKKQLLLRFSNDFDYVVNSMTYVVVQIDAAGKVIARKKITHKDMELYPGGMYVTEQPIDVDEYCSDFKIEFSEVISESYRYEVHSDMIAVHYIKTVEPLLDLSEMKRKEKRKRKDVSVRRYHVKRKKFQERGVAAFVAAILTIVMLGLNILNMVGIYISARKPHFFGDLPYVGDLLLYINKNASYISQYLNFLAYKETVLVLLAAVALLFAIALMIHSRIRKSAG